MLCASYGVDFISLYMVLNAAGIDWQGWSSHLSHRRDFQSGTPAEMTTAVSSVIARYVALVSRIKTKLIVGNERYEIH